MNLWPVLKCCVLLLLNNFYCFKSKLAMHQNTTCALFLHTSTDVLMCCPYFTFYAMLLYIEQFVSVCLSVYLCMCVCSTLHFLDCHIQIKSALHGGGFQELKLSCVCGVRIYVCVCVCLDAFNDFVVVI